MGNPRLVAISSALKIISGILTVPFAYYLESQGYFDDRK